MAIKKLSDRELNQKLMESIGVKDVEARKAFEEMMNEKVQQIRAEVREEVYEELSKQLGCPLDFIFKVLKAPKIYIEGMNVRSEYDDSFKFNSKTNNYIISPYARDGKKPEFLFVDRWSYGYDLRLKDYKKTWFLKEDRSE